MEKSYLKNYIAMAVLLFSSACSSPTTQESGQDFGRDSNSILDVTQEKDLSELDIWTDSSQSDLQIADVSKDSDSNHVDMGQPTFDVLINPSCEPGHAKLLRFYQSFLGRLPDIDGANFWMSQFIQGKSLEFIAEQFEKSSESQALYKDLSIPKFVEAAFQNSFNHKPDSEGKTYFVNELNSGRLTRIGFLITLADSLEMRNLLPYKENPFCLFVAQHSAGYTRTQIAPHTVHLRSGNGDINAIFIDYKSGGSLKVPKPESTTAKCTNRSIPIVRQRRVGHFGGTLAINGNWFGCYLPKYFAGYSVSEGLVLGATMDGREGYLGVDKSGKLSLGFYADQGGNNPSKLQHAISGKRIVTAGKLWAQTTTSTTDPTLRTRHPRTSGGLASEDYLVLAVVDGRRFGPGMTGSELGNLMLSFGVHEALMFDGGGSSTLFIKDKGVVNQPSDGNPRSVANQLVFDASKIWIKK